MSVLGAHGSGAPVHMETPAFLSLCPLYPHFPSGTKCGILNSVTSVDLINLEYFVFNAMRLIDCTLADPYLQFDQEQVGIGPFKVISGQGNNLIVVVQV